MLKGIELDQHSELWKQVLHCPRIESMAARGWVVVACGLRSALSLELGVPIRGACVFEILPNGLGLSWSL